MKKEIPLLTPKDVELRVQQIFKTEKGFFGILLVYKEARTDMNILDEVFGPMNWQRVHRTNEKGEMLCSVKVWDEEKRQWVEKEDVGEESYTEAVKGKASDAFKRASVNWGIGRELYNAPEICIKLDDSEVKTSGDNKYKTYSKFRVSKMLYDKEKKEYTTFDVVDKTGSVRFSIEKSIAQKKVTPIENAKQTTNVNSCSVCGESIDERVLSFSLFKFNRPLCRNCQKTANKVA